VPISSFGQGEGRGESGVFDTILVSTRTESFLRVFLQERAWYPLRIDDRRLKNLLWIAAYRSSPIQAITHFAKIVQVAPYRDTGRYAVTFEEPIECSRPLTLGSFASTSMQQHRYVRYKDLSSSHTVQELLARAASPIPESVGK
jgi:hypothetical protein